MVVQHNLSAANTNRQLQINTGAQAKSAEKLSSGYRINRAADDASGLSISEKLRYQIRGLTQGVSNTEDGVSVCQVADGALAEVTDMLHRITELSVQAANDTNTDSDRQAIQREIHELIQEIDRIGETTEYNTMPIFQGGNVTNVGGATTSSPVTVNSVSGMSDFTAENEFNTIYSTYKLSCSGDTVTLSTDAIPSYNAMTSVSDTWEHAGLRIENGMVKEGMYNLRIGETSGLHVTMVVNVEKDISMAEFNQAMDAGEIEYTCTYNSNGPRRATGFGSLNNMNMPNAFFQMGDIKHLIEDLNLEWTPPNNSFKVVLHRDANGKIYGELPNGIRLTEDDKPVSSGGELLQIGRWGHNGEPYYSLKFYFDISQYDLDSVESGLEFYMAADPGTARRYSFTGFTPASTSTAGSLSAPKQWWIQSGDTEGSGFFIEFDKMNTHVLGIRNLDVSTRDGAQEAISASQKALGIVSEMRSKIGAQQNRLEYAASNSRNMAENAQNAESRIRDTDMAEEMVANATASILVQAGQSVLAQNNHKSDGVLELLR